MDKKKALANYLGIDVETINDGYRDDVFETEDAEEYIVVTDEEADELVVEDIGNLIDELGLKAFTESMQDWILQNALSPTDWFEDAQRESAEFYIEDIENESDSEYETRLLSELVDNDILSDDDFHEDEDGNKVLNDDVDLDDAKEQYIDKMCEEDAFEWYKWNFGDSSLRELIKEGRISLDYETIADECVSWDGRGHSLASYDGDELELEDGLYAYRIN